MLKKLISILLAVALIMSCITVMGADTIESVPDPNLLPAVDGGEVTLSYPGFEVSYPSLIDYISDWKLYNAEVSDEYAHDGTYSAKLSAPAGDDARVSQNVYNLDAGATYQISAWVYRPQAIGNFRFSLEYYNDEGIMHKERLNVEQTEGVWSQLSATFVMPAGVTRVRVYWRLFATETEDAVAYVDDVALCMVAEPLHFWFNTDQLYYYTNDDVTTGTARLTANSEIFPEYTSWTADVSILDGETCFFTQTGLPFTSEELEVDFPLSLLSDPQKSYTVRASVKSADGENLMDNETVVCRKFSRPSMIDKEGRIYVDGEEFMPVLGYHVYNRDDYREKAKSFGVNVIQTGYGKATNPDEVIAALDTLEATGFMGLVCLYGPEGSGWGDTYQEATKNLIPLIKDHPALFGYCIDDEPDYHNPGTEAMAEAYEFIRGEDSEHPVYACNMNKAHAEILSYYHDIVGFDCYPYGRQQTETYIAEVAETAAFYTQNTKKPIMTVLQFFQHPDYDYFPTADEIRNMLYQNYFAGGNCIGIYAIGSETVTDPDTGETVRNLDTPTADALAAWNSAEKDIVSDHFMFGKGDIIKEEKTDTLWWRLWQDGTKYYLLALNRTNAATNADLESSAFSAAATIEVIGGADKNSITSLENDTIGLYLPASGAVLYSFGDGEIASDESKYGSWRLYVEGGKLYVEAENFYTWKNYNPTINSPFIKENMTCSFVENSGKGEVNFVRDGSLSVKAYCGKSATFLLNEE